MPKNLKMVSKNLVVVFNHSVDTPNSEETSQLTSLVKGEKPDTIIINEPGAPWVIRYKRAGFDITGVEQRLQLQSVAPADAHASEHFADLCKDAVGFLGDKRYQSFGFNYNWTFDMDEDVKDIIGINERLLSLEDFEYAGEASFKLSFLKGDIVFNFDIKDGDPLYSHINTHFNQPGVLYELRERVPELYKDSLDSAQHLLDEVLGYES